MRKKAYIAGPITGMDLEEILENFRAGVEAASRRGYFVISPIDMDYTLDGSVNETPALEDRIKFARRDTHIILNEMRAERGDIIVLLPGWEKSTGAITERALGIWVGLRIQTLDEIRNENEL